MISVFLSSLNSLKIPCSLPFVVSTMATLIVVQVALQCSFDDFSAIILALKVDSSGGPPVQDDSAMY